MFPLQTENDPDFSENSRKSDVQETKRTITDEVLLKERHEASSSPMESYGVSTHVFDLDDCDMNSGENDIGNEHLHGDHLVTNARPRHPGRETEEKENATVKNMFQMEKARRASIETTASSPTSLKKNHNLSV